MSVTRAQLRRRLLVEMGLRPHWWQLWRWPAYWWKERKRRKNYAEYKRQHEWASTPLVDAYIHRPLTANESDRIKQL